LRVVQATHSSLSFISQLNAVGRRKRSAEKILISRVELKYEQALRGLFTIGTSGSKMSLKEKVDGKLGLKRGHGLTVHHTEKGTNDRT